MLSNFIFGLHSDGFYRNERDMAVRLKNHWQSPIDGFHFTQPETGASFHEWGFDYIVGKIIAHRQQNPRFNLSLDPKQVGAEVDLQNAMRMQSIPGGELYIINDGGGGAPNFPVPRPSRLLSVAGLSKLGSGIGAWSEMFQGGQPVEPALAAKRAEVCASCPQNQKGDLTSWFTVPAVNHIKGWYEALIGHKITTPIDDKLNVCVACLCPLKAVVHFPIEIKLKHLTADARAKLDPRCWVTQEEAKK